VSNRYVDSGGNLSLLLRRARAGDAAAEEALFSAAYQELRALAHARLRRAPRGELLDTTSLVHESWLRIARAGALRMEDRAHFFAYCGRVMRSVVVDEVRAQLAERRGGDAVRVTLVSDVMRGDGDGATEILRVHEALEELGKQAPRLVQVVELRYFAGLTEQEIADALGVTERTVRRDWEKARLWLLEAMQSR
jgi:RNA polymerase sigma factor (TIGR02999 family)